MEVGGEEIVGLQIASVSRVRNFSGRIVARSFHNACRAMLYTMQPRRRTFSCAVKEPMEAVQKGDE